MKRPILAALLSAALIQPALAGELTDQIMSPGLFADQKTEGAILRYELARQMPSVDGALPGAESGVTLPRAVKSGQVVLLRAETGLELQLAEDDQALHTVAEFPDGAPNPVLLMFLENVVRTVAVHTGGSSYYIRNRIRDSMVAAPAPAAGADVHLQPFANDPKKANLGDFADLALTIRYDPAAPQRLVELIADTGAGGSGYTETLRLLPTEE